MSKTEIKIEGMPERGVGKRVFREYLVVYADDKDGKTYPVYINSSLVVERRDLREQVKLEVTAREKFGQRASNFRLVRMDEGEAVEKGLLAGMDINYMPQMKTN